MGNVHSNNNIVKPGMRYRAGHFWPITAVVTLVQSFGRNKTANIAYKGCC